MSKADKMFEKLGYEKIETKDEITYHFNNRDIIFYLNRKTVDSCSGFSTVFITMQELQAINEKCKELGWLVYVLSQNLN